MKTKRKKLFLSLFCILSLFFFMQPVFAESIPENVPFNGVYDPHNYLSSEAVSNISGFNWQYTKDTSNKADPRLAVIIIEELDNELDKVVDYTAESWNFAHSKVFRSAVPEMPDTYELDNGILLFISVKDGLVRTKTARRNSLNLDEQAISNLESVLKNNFEKGNYSQGIYSYVELLKEKIGRPEKYEHDASEFGSKTKNMTPEEQEAQKEDWAFKEGARDGRLIGVIILVSIPFVIMLYSFIKFLFKGIFKFIFKFLIGDAKDVFKNRK